MSTCCNYHDLTQIRKSTQGRQDLKRTKGIPQTVPAYQTLLPGRQNLTPLSGHQSLLQPGRAPNRSAQIHTHSAYTLETIETDTVPMITGLTLKLTSLVSQVRLISHLYHTQSP